jgi:hypothetical protein
MIVWVASFQRSGNTLTLRTLADVYGINRIYTRHEDLKFFNDRGWRIPRYKVPEELVGLENDELLEALRARPETFFVKTHWPVYAPDPAPALHIVRDGRDAHVSRAHWAIDKQRGRYRDLTFEEALREMVNTPMWTNHFRAWSTRSAPTARIRFEDLVEDSAATLKRACDEIGVPLPEPVGELTPFEELHKRDPAMHRSGKAGSWREEMSPEIEEEFWSVHGPTMEALGYTKGEVGAGDRAGAGTG